jgi:hypothetical protein
MFISPFDTTLNPPTWKKLLSYPAGLEQLSFLVSMVARGVVAGERFTAGPSVPPPVSPMQCCSHRIVQFPDLASDVAGKLSFGDLFGNCIKMMKAMGRVLTFTSSSFFTSSFVTLSY